MANLLISGLCAGVVANNSRMEIQLDGSCVSTRTTVGEINDLITGDITVNACSVSALAANSVDTAELADNAVGLAEMATGTDGNLISYDACTNPVAVATGTCGQVLTSNGAGAAPTFQAAGGGGTAGYTVVSKTSDQTFANACYANVCCQSFAVDACSRYTFIHWIIFTAATADDMKVQYTVPACTDACGWDDNFDQPASLLNTLANTALMCAGASCGLTYTMRIGSILTSTTAGTVQVQASKAFASSCTNAVYTNRSYIAWAKLT